MSSTRDFKNPGIFAENATTVIPPTPIAGVAYRDPVNGADDTPNGWRYGTRVASQDWNQIMLLITSLTGMMDRQGLLGWSDQVEYAVPALVFGSDGLPYIALQASGPSTAAQDPTAAPAYWEQFALHGSVSFPSAGVVAWTVPMSMQLGYVRPSVTVIGGGAGGSASTGVGVNQAGSGGGAGGIARSIVDLSGVTSVSVTTGAGGASAIAGGASSFGAFLSATGGLVGTPPGLGDGGIGSGGNILNDTLGSGFQRHTNDTNQVSGKGGGLGGGPSIEAGTVVGRNAVGIGCGGGGGTGGAAGGTGRAGIVIIEW